GRGRSHGCLAEWGVGRMRPRPQWWCWLLGERRWRRWDQPGSGLVGQPDPQREHHQDDRLVHEGQPRREDLGPAGRVRQLLGQAGHPDRGRDGSRHHPDGHELHLRVRKPRRAAGPREGRHLEVRRGHGRLGQDRRQAGRGQRRHQQRASLLQPQALREGEDGHARRHHLDLGSADGGGCRGRRQGEGAVRGGRVGGLRRLVRHLRASARQGALHRRGDWVRAGGSQRLVRPHGQGPEGQGDGNGRADQRGVRQAAGPERHRGRQGGDDVLQLQPAGSGPGCGRQRRDRHAARAEHDGQRDRPEDLVQGKHALVGIGQDQEPGGRGRLDQLVRELGGGSQHRQGGAGHPAARRDSGVPEAQPVRGATARGEVHHRHPERGGRDPDRPTARWGHDRREAEPPRYGCPLRTGQHGRGRAEVRGRGQVG
ncbi:MAG: ABC transporter, substrate-binding protein (cluster 1, maltose/g3p/polyamine/iron), partial [uncultured Friedmanniella sp.]